MPHWVGEALEWRHDSRICLTDLEDLREAVAGYTSRAAEKLRAQGDYCRLLQVYIRTGDFNPNEQHYGRSANVPLPCTSHV